jgi:hypothetical protein
MRRTLLLAASLSIAVVSLEAATVPAGTAIVVSLNEGVSSKTSKVGQKVTGSVSQPVVVAGKTVIPKGSSVTMAVASVQESGRLKTPAKLWLKIRSIHVGGTTYNVDSRWSGQAGPSHNKRNVVSIGGGTAAGAIIGAIAGGGKGAAIGAAAGAAAGTAGAAATGKKDIAFPPETRLRFALRTALELK